MDESKPLGVVSFSFCVLLTLMPCMAAGQERISRSLFERTVDRASDPTPQIQRHLFFMANLLLERDTSQLAVEEREARAERRGAAALCEHKCLPS